MTDGDKLKVGKKYEINFNDCCVTGTLVGTFIAYVNYDDEVRDFEDFDLYKFDIGTFGYSYYPFEFKEIEDGNSVHQ